MPKRGFSKNSISIEILRTLGTGAALFFVLSSPQGTRRLLRGVRKELQSRKAYAALDRLQRCRLVSYRVLKDKTIRVELTERGKLKILDYEVDKIFPLKQKKWDGIWRIIFSDIPERHKKARDALRRKFYEWGVYPLQKSVFVYPYPCEDEIVIIRDIFHIPTHSLLILETKQVGDTKKLKSHFNLK